MFFSEVRQPLVVASGGDAGHPEAYDRADLPARLLLGDPPATRGLRVFGGEAFPNGEDQFGEEARAGVGLSV